jgi:uncharacterized protein (DUF1778 family)
MKKQQPPAVHIRLTEEVYAALSKAAAAAGLSRLGYVRSMIIRVLRQDGFLKPGAKVGRNA